MGIPLVDLKAQYKRIKSEIDGAIARVLESTQFIGGETVATFERNFARYVEAGSGVGVSSGTAALHLALKVLGVGTGDEVITSCNTFIATTEAITLTGAKPVLVDVVDESLTIDPGLVERAVTLKTKAIIPVHLYGQGADMEAVRDIASRHSLSIVTDAAQAHGARIGGSRKALLGDISCFSFYPGKNLGAYGDGGMVVTDSVEFAEQVRVLANHGRSSKHIHAVEGYNYRLDAIQAAVLDVKLKHLDEWTEERRARAVLYDSRFDGDRARPVGEAKGCYHVYHLYVVRVAGRDRLREKLSEKGIATGIHYPVPLHLLKAYEHLGLKKGTFPVAEKAAGEILSLPMYPELTDDMVHEVAEAIEQSL